jgi:flagellin
LQSELNTQQAQSRNANDAKSLVTAAEGGLNEINNHLLRLREITSIATSDWIGDNERDALSIEADSLKAEIDRVANSTHYLNNPLLNGTGRELNFQIGAKNEDYNKLTYPSQEFDATVGGLGVDGVSLSSSDGAQDALYAIDDAISKVQLHRAKTGALQSRLESVVRHTGSMEDLLKSDISRIRDTDIARESTNLLTAQIRQQASIAVISQTRNLQKELLKLIG